MCGRARCSLRVDDIPRSCHRTTGPSRVIDMDRYRPSYNVSPGFNLPVVRKEDGAADSDGYAIQCMRWGLVPSFTKKNEKPDFYRMFNARSESIGEKASFRRLLPKNRCIVAVEGFYEWKKDGSKKQPYYIHFKDGRPLVFAALYDSWKNSEGDMLHTFTIVTTSSSSALQWLHDRMPVILGDKEAIDTWLNDSHLAKFDVVLKPYEGPDLVWYPVTPAMGKPSFDGPECIKEVHFKPEENNTISKFFARKATPVKVEEESNPEKSNTLNTSVNTALSETVKQEPGNDERLEEILSVAEVADHNLKSDPFRLSHGDETSPLRKRNHMEPAADAKLNTDDSSPARKKADHKSGGDKQPTLFSFFGKK